MHLVYIGIHTYLIIILREDESGSCPLFVLCLLCICASSDKPKLFIICLILFHHVIKNTK